MNKFKEVDQSTFEQFLKSYSRRLHRDVCGIYEPPLVTYNDFTFGNWPDSVVASCFLTDDNIFRIMEEHEDEKLPEKADEANNQAEDPSRIGTDD